MCSQRAENKMSAQWPVLLYDGACGFCHATVRFILRRDRVGTLRFASLSSPFGESIVNESPELQSVDSIVWVGPKSSGQPAKVAIRSAAALRIASYLGGAWRLTLALWIVPRPIRDWAYGLVARHRHKLMGTAERCFIAPPDARQRFLDEE
jgi:predicted DCC family thiol-disulfide oxidoreductase YuxK